MKRVKVKVEFYVDVEPLEDEDEFGDNHAASAADLAVHESMTFIKGDVGYSERVAEDTEVHVDGYGAARVVWPGDLLDGETMTLTCEVQGGTATPRSS